MRPARTLITRMFPAALALVISSAWGAEVYKWVGDDGVTHYAEAPPEASLSSLEILKIATPDPASPVVGGYQSALDVANSIETSRLERERVRLEREQLLLRERQFRQSQLDAQQRYAREQATYYLPRYRHPPKPYPPRYGRHPRPTPYGDRSRPGRGDSSARALFDR